MSTTVLLVSSETLPNVLFIKEFPAEKYVFVTTQRMETEKRSHWIIRATGIQESQVQRLLVNQDDFESILVKLKETNLTPDASWNINITCGNKLMSIAFFHFFAGYKSKIYYLAADSQHFQQIYPNIQHHPIRYHVDLKTYLMAYGYDFERIATIDEHLKKEAVKLMNTCREVQGIVGENKYLMQKLKQQNHTPQERVFYSGHWFEIYTYETIRQLLNLNEQQIALGMGIYDLNQPPKERKTHNKDNDIDVCFVWKNYLYLLECKVYPRQHHVKNVSTDVVTTSMGGEISSPLYKLAAVKQNLGLNSRAILITPNNLSSNASSWQAIEKRCNILKISKPWDFNVLKDNKCFEQFISKL